MCHSRHYNGHPGKRSARSAQSFIAHEIPIGDITVDDDDDFVDTMDIGEEEKKIFDSEEEEGVCVPLEITNLCGHVANNETASLIVLAAVILAFIAELVFIFACCGLLKKGLLKLCTARRCPSSSFPV